MLTLVIPQPCNSSKIIFWGFFFFANVRTFLELSTRSLHTRHLTEAGNRSQHTKPPRRAQKKGPHTGTSWSNLPHRGLSGVLAEFEIRSKSLNIYLLDLIFQDA